MNPEMPMQMAQQGLPAWVIVFYLAIYVFTAYCMARLAARTGMEMGKSFILALIPIANVYLIMKMAGKPGWWTILAFIPLVNIIIFILAWISYLQRIGKPGWWVILLLIPVVNIIVFLMLAFGKNEASVAA